MAEQTYPFGYGTGRLSLAAMIGRYKPGCHPEVWPCVEALLVWGGGRWGIGGAGRKVQPNKPGFAPPGMSFHEWQRFASGIEAYSAFDLVMTVPGGKHRAPTWTEARELEQFGLWAFISGEPWHAQRKMYAKAKANLIRGHRSWVNAGRPDPDRWPLPHQPVHPAPPSLAPDVPYSPPSEWWLFPIDKSKPRLDNGSVDADVIGHVRYLQDAIWHGGGGDIHRDGHFGDETERRVKDLQRTFKLDQDGVVGPQTWKAVDQLVARVLEAQKPKPAKPAPSKPAPAPPKPAPVNTGVTAVSPCLYWVRPGDSPWSVGKRIYGSGQMGVDLLDPALFRAPNVHIPIPQVAGFTTAVRPGEGAIRLMGRLVGTRDVSTFYAWNGGQARRLHPGDIVHVPGE